MFSPLIVSRRSPLSRRVCLKGNTFQHSIKAEIKIEAGLFPIGDDIKPGAQLILNRYGGGVVLHFGNVVGPEFIQARGAGFQPGGKGVTPNNGGTKRAVFHKSAKSRHSDISIFPSKEK